MFYENLQPMNTNEESNEDIHLKNKRIEKFETTIARQRDSRHKIIERLRFKSEDFWDFDELGYQSDDNNSSVIGLDQISLKDIMESILGCYPPNGEQSLEIALNAVLYQFDGYKSKTMDKIYHYFFSHKILNKMSSLIGSEDTQISNQINIFKLYEEFVTKQPLSQNQIQNLITSSMIPKLIQILMSGNELVVERCLQLILLSLECNSSSNLFLLHILNTDLIRNISMRTDKLRWKTIKSNSSDLKTNKRQLVCKNNFSLTAKSLFVLFANCIYRLLGLIMDLKLQMDVFNAVTPIIQKLFACPEPIVIPTAIDCLRIVAKNQGICLSIINTFGSTLLSLTKRNEESIILSTIYALNTLFCVCPQIMTLPFGPQSEVFASIVRNYLNETKEKLKQQNKNNKNIDSKITEFIEIIDESIGSKKKSVNK